MHEFMYDLLDFIRYEPTFIVGMVILLALLVVLFIGMILVKAPWSVLLLVVIYGLGWMSKKLIQHRQS